MREPTATQTRQEIPLPNFYPLNGPSRCKKICLHTLSFILYLAYYKILAWPRHAISSISRADLCESSTNYCRNWFFSLISKSGNIYESVFDVLLVRCRVRSHSVLISSTRSPFLSIRPLFRIQGVLLKGPAEKGLKPRWGGGVLIGAVRGCHDQHLQLNIDLPAACSHCSTLPRAPRASHTWFWFNFRPPAYISLKWDLQHKIRPPRPWRLIGHGSKHYNL